MTDMPIPDGWTERDGGIERRFRFDDFPQAFAFMTRVAFIAEAADHHPDWTNVWNRVDIRLTTHDANDGAGGLTERDLALANEINRLR